MTIGVTGATSDPLIIYLTNMFSFEPYFRIICIIVSSYTTAMFPFLIFDTNYVLILQVISFCLLTQRLPYPEVIAVYRTMR